MEKKKKNDRKTEKEKQEFETKANRKFFFLFFNQARQ